MYSKGYALNTAIFYTVKLIFQEVLSRSYLTWSCEFKGIKLFKIDSPLSFDYIGLLGLKTIRSRV